MNTQAAPVTESAVLSAGRQGTIIHGDALKALQQLGDSAFQAVVADPPYFQVLQDADWDNAWNSSEEWLEWSMDWLTQSHRVLREDGLLFVFGQLGKREHSWLHFCSQAANVATFHDMLIWDRALGYSDRNDSFTPAYEMALVLRKAPNSRVYFDKDAVRIPYDEATIQKYLKDNRYKDKVERERQLRLGKKSTNILRVPSLKGAGKQQWGHPSQKPEQLIEMLVASSTKPGDRVLDPFLGSGTTGVVCERLDREWVGIECSQTYVDMASARIAQETHD